MADRQLPTLPFRPTWTFKRTFSPRYQIHHFILHPLVTPPTQHNMKVASPPEAGIGMSCTDCSARACTSTALGPHFVAQCPLCGGEDVDADDDNHYYFCRACLVIFDVDIDRAPHYELSINHHDSRVIRYARLVSSFSIDDGDGGGVVITTGMPVFDSLDEFQQIRWKLRVVSWWTSDHRPNCFDPTSMFHFEQTNGCKGRMRRLAWIKY